MLYAIIAVLLKMELWQ